MSAIEELKRRQAALTEDQRRLLEQHLRRAVARAGSVPLPRRPPGTLPLSAAQARLWFLQQLDPSTAAYNETFAVRLKGDLDVARLARAVEQLVRRHAVFRARFSVDGEELREWLVPAADAVPSPQIDDLSSTPAADRRAVVAQAVRAEAAAPFDLERGPLLRTRLLQLSPVEHVAVVAMHHIAADGWSIEIFLRDLVALYAGGESGWSALPALPLEYADYAHWQAEWLDSEACRREVAFWRSELAGAAPLLPLPVDRPRPIRPSGEGFDVRQTLGPETVSALRAVAADEDATLFMVLAAAVSIYLGRVCCTNDVVVGTAVAGRTHPDLENLVGPFVNTLALRMHTAPGETFREAVRRARETSLAAFAHQEVPFERIVEELRPPRVLGSTPVFQVMLVLQNFPYTGDALPGLAVEPVPIDHRTAKFDLSIIARERGPELELALELNADIFDRGTGNRLGDELGRLLADLASSPDAPTTDSRRERASPVRRPSTCVLDLFDRSVGRVPGHPACAGSDGTLTYAELDRRSNDLAAELVASGVGRGDVVGLYVGCTTGFPVGFLGILRAGAVCLPLECEDPPERTRWILADARAQAVVTERDRRERITGGRTVVLLDAVRPAEWRQPAPPEPTAPASLIYTSGSTGRPNGVVSTHAALGAHSRAIVARYALSRPDRVLQLASPAFDVAEEELFPTLAAGATVVIPPTRGANLFAALDELLTAEAISVVNLSSSVWEAWVEELERGAVFPPSLRLVVTGSEPAATQTFARWRVVAPPTVRLLHAYGTTEATITTTVYEPGEGEPAAAALPVGTPLPGATVHVLDDRLRPVPPGGVGEVCIGGTMVAARYHRRPERTRRRFVTIAGARGAERVFRSGDLGRWRHDGALELVGRRDDQVNLHGLRVDPRELEHALRLDPSVRAALVVARGEGAARSLIAYVVPSSRGTVDAHRLRGLLRRTVPHAQIPPSFVFLDDLPRSPSGKVDRSALPPPLATGRTRPGRKPYADVVAALAADLLELPDVPREADLFELGAHSLLLARLAARVRSTFGVDLPLRVYFEEPSVSGIAERVAAAHLADAHSGSAVAVDRLPAGAEAPVSFAQEQLLSLGPSVVTSGLFSIGVAVRLRGELQLARLRSSVQEVVNRHAVLRSEFRAGEEGFVQVPIDDPDVPFEATDLRGMAASAREAALNAAAEVFVSRPYDPPVPLLRVLVARLDSDQWAVVLAVHHLAADATSIEIIGSELALLYAASAAGEAQQLTGPAIQYGDFAAWERSLLTSERLEADLSYWRSALASVPPLFAAPPAPSATPTYEYDRHESRLEPDLVAALTAFGRREGASLFMTVLGALTAVLARVTGQEQLLVGTLVENRALRELETVVGLFINTVALRLDARGDPSFAELVARARTEVLAGVTHGAAPFELVRKEVGDDDRPLFDVLCLHDRRGFGDPSLPGLELRALPIGTGGPNPRVLPSDLALIVEVVEDVEGVGITFLTSRDRLDVSVGRSLLEALTSSLDESVAAYAPNAQREEP